MRWKANRIYTREMNVYVLTKMYMNDHSRFICNSQKLWTSQVPINRWMDKQIMVYPFNKYYPATEKNELFILQQYVCISK